MCEKEQIPENIDDTVDQSYLDKYIEIYAKTDIGKVRPKNQDVCRIIIPSSQASSYYNQILAVADGMGGHKSGEVASNNTVRLLEQHLSEQSTENLSEVDNPETLPLKQAIIKANSEVHKQALSPEYQGMGTTLVVSAINSNQATIANIGDSRCYLYRDGRLESVTKDHSVVRFMIESGSITEEESKTHPQRNVITRAIGLDENVEIDMFHVTLFPDDILLLCTDGLHGYVDPCKIANILGSNNPEEATDLLVSAALDEGGHDNIAVIVAKFKQPLKNIVNREISERTGTLRSGWASRLIKKLTGILRP